MCISCAGVTSMVWLVGCGGQRATSVSAVWRKEWKFAEFDESFCPFSTGPEMAGKSAEHVLCQPMPCGLWSFADG